MNNYMIKTERGYEDFVDVRKVYKPVVVYIRTDNNMLKCTEDHRLLVGKCNSGRIFRQAKNLKVGDKLTSGKIMDIVKKEVETEFYDVVGVKGNTYTTNGIESHNCNIIYTDEAAYIKKSLWDEFIDAVMPTMNSLIFKQVISTSTANGMNHFQLMCTGAANHNSTMNDFTASPQATVKIGASSELTPEELYVEFQRVKASRLRALKGKMDE